MAIQNDKIKYEQLNFPFYMEIVDPKDLSNSSNYDIYFFYHKLYRFTYNGKVNSNC